MSNWQQEVVKAIDESFTGGQGIFLDQGTDPLTELRALSSEQASREIPGAGNSVANQVKHLLTTIAMHRPQFMGGEYPDLDWNADWLSQHLTDDAWQQLIDDLERSKENLKGWIAAPANEQNQEYASACIMVVTHLAFHIGQIQHASGYVRQA